MLSFQIMAGVFRAESISRARASFRTPLTCC